MQIFHEIRNHEDGFAVWNHTYENMGFLAHWHREIECIYLRQGSLQVVVDGVCYYLQQGDFFLCGSKSLHYSQPCPHPSNVVEFLLFDPKLITAEYFTDHLRFHFSALELEQKNLQQPLNYLLQLVNRELEMRHPFYQNIVQAAITEFWYHIRRCHPQETQQQTDRRQQQLKDFLHYLHQHFREEISLTIAAEALGLTPSYFSMYFKKQVGTNFVSYLQMLRVEEAIRRLQQRKDKIIDIALDCGFTNIRSFNRVFRQLTGMTPLAVQKGAAPHYTAVVMPQTEDAQALNVDAHSSVVILT